MRPPSSVRHRAIVIGGSLGGLFVGNLLHRAGWQVDIFERAGEAMADRGAGLATHPELFAALERAGIAIDRTIGVEVPARITFGPRGETIGMRPYRQVFTGWSRLYELLGSAFPAAHYHSGWSFVGLEQDAACVTARFAHGESATADLLVAADGIRSTVRGLLLPGIKPLYAGYVAWRGLVEEAALSPATHAELFERFAFCLPPGEQMLGYPLAGANDAAAPGRRRYNFVWYRPVDERRDLPRLLTDDHGVCHAQGIPPHLIGAEAVAEMRKAAARILSPQFAEVVDRTKHPFFQPIYDLKIPRMAFGRAVILGDAAFVARPHCGMGVTKAAGDAVAMAGALAGDAPLAEALGRFETARLSFGAEIVEHARHLGAYMQAQLRTAEEREMAERHRTPEAVMRETAVPPPFEAAA